MIKKNSEKFKSGLTQQDVSKEYVSGAGSSTSSIPWDPKDEIDRLALSTNNPSI